MAMQSALAAMMGGDNQPATQGLGPPPDMPGLPPPPTGAGAMPTGSTSSDPKAAADNAILALRDAQGQFPSLAGQIGSMIDALKAAAGKSGAGGPTSAPSDPGTPPPAVPGPSASGSPGPM